MAKRPPKDGEALSAEELVEYHAKRWQEEGPEYLDGLLKQDADPAGLEELARAIGAPQGFTPNLALRALAEYRSLFGSEQRAGQLAVEAGQRVVVLWKKLSGGEGTPADIEEYLRLRSLFEAAEPKYQKRKGQRKGGQAEKRARCIEAAIRKELESHSPDELPTAKEIWDKLRKYPHPEAAFDDEEAQVEST